MDFFFECRFEGSCHLRHEDDVKNGTVYSIITKEDLVKLEDQIGSDNGMNVLMSRIKKNLTINPSGQEEPVVKHVKKRGIFTRKTLDYLSTFDLKTVNMFVIYVVLSGGGLQVLFKDLIRKDNVLEACVAGLSIPGVGGACDMNAQGFVVTALKTFTKMDVSFSKLNMYSEPEFKDFVQFDKVDKQLSRDFHHKITMNIMKQIVKAWEEDIYHLDNEPWFTALPVEQQNIINEYNKAIEPINKRIKEMGKEAYQEHNNSIVRKGYDIVRRMNAPRSFII